uniref:Down syndrome cell adhesion molecule-like protein Dscam2 n=1 Tax=Strigamia maritima TaxID=126957 RepID=T1J817_STRMM
MATLANTRSRAALMLILHMALRIAESFQDLTSEPEGPVFTTGPPLRVDFANSTGARIDCTARGNPSPLVKWTLLDGNSADDIPGLRHVLSNGSLIFLPFRPEDYRADVHSVTYICHAKNTWGTIRSRDMQVRAVVLQLYEVQVYDEYAIRGNTAVMRCHIPSFVKDYVSVMFWLEEPASGGSTNVIETGGRYLITATGELHIGHANTSDNANAYRCRTLHRLTGEMRLSAVSPSGRLYVTEPRGSVPPRITDHRPSVHVVQGDAVLLPCAAQGFPLPSYSWFAKMNEVEVLPISTSSRILLMGGSLMLTSALILDAGTYICEVSNSMGVVRIETILTVSAPLSAYIYPQRQVVDVGQSATLTCVISGYPFTQVTWMKDGRPLLTDTINQLSQEVLRLDAVHRRDRGMYQCFVNNHLEVVQGTAELILGDILPEFQRVFSDKVVQTGSFVSLECAVSGSPTPQVVWTLDGQVLKNRNNKVTSANFVDDNSDVMSLVNISQVGVADGGEYVCTASNRAGSVRHVGRINVQGPPLIRLVSNVAAVAGTDLVVRCYVSGFPIDSVHWERDDRMLPFTIRQNVYPNGTLLIQNVQKALDEGQYTCAAKAGRLVDRKQTNISVMAPPKIIPFSFQDEHLREGTRARIQCVLSEGDLPIAISWLKDSRSISAQLGILIRDLDDFSSMLTVNNVSSLLHNGNYTCVATNTAATANYTSELSVNVPPKILPFSFRDVQLQEGMRAQITCAISEGDQPVRMTWLKDGHPLNSALGVVVREFDEHTSSMSIERVFSVHGGNYSCKAGNRAAEVQHTAQLLVNVPPRWLTQPQNTEVILGGSTYLSCQVDGFPKPTVTWMKAVGDAPGDYRDIAFELLHFKLNEEGDLQVLGAEEADKGYYLCKASNGIGAGLSEVVYLSVHGDLLVIPQLSLIAAVPAYFQTKTRNVTAKMGGRAELVCEAYGDKPLTISWSAHRDPARADALSKYNVNDNYWEKGTISELVIEKVEKSDSGVYPCVATNAYGEDESHVQLIVQDVSDAPLHLRASDIGSRKIRLAWTAPFSGYSPINLYILEIKDKSEDEWKDGRNLTVSGHATECIVEALEPAKSYHMRLYAKNEIGTSKASKHIEVTTNIEAPGGPPLEVRVEAVDSTCLNVYWKPPRSDLWHGKLTGYKIGFRQHEIKEIQFRVVRLEDNENEADEFVMRLTHLKKFTKYRVVVAAVNQMGDGPFSDDILARTAEDVPSRSPEGLQCSPISSQGLSVSWDPPPTNSVHGQLQGYKVLYKPVSEWYDDMPTEVKISQTWKTTIHGLEKYKNYSIYVLAFTRVGDGVRSEPVFCLTKEDVPDAPAAIKTLIISSSAVLVVWKSPLRTNGIITKYVVFMRNSDSGNDEIRKFVVSSNKTLMYEIGNLKKNHQYEFWVTASTSVGEGASTKAITQIPSSRVPAKIAAFDETVISQWQESITLDCYSVGNPTPLIEWRLNNVQIQVTKRFEILPTGSLFISQLQNSDAGLYTCRVQNIYASDAVVYTLKVQGPPQPPRITYLKSTFSSIHVQWEVSTDIGNPVEGYIVYYKRDFGEWESVQLGSVEESHSLDDLWCGTRYQLYIVAWNKVGIGEANEIKSIRTQGSAPELPAKHKLVHENVSSIGLNLSSWENGGCPILYFVVEYQPVNHHEWMLVSNNVKVQQFLILDLAPATKYVLRVTAHNSAGSTIGVYEFVTKPHGVDILDEVTNEMSPNSGFYLDVNITFPIAALLSFLIVASTCVICCRRYRVNNSIEGSDGGSEPKRYEARYVVTGDKKSCILGNEIDKGSFTCLLVNTEGADTSSGNTPRNAKRVAPRGEIQPYATYQLPECCTDAFTPDDWKRFEIYNPGHVPMRAVMASCAYPQVRKERECIVGAESSDDQGLSEYASPVRSSDTSDSTSGTNPNNEAEMGTRIVRQMPKPRKPGKRAKVPDLIYRRHVEWRPVNMAGPSDTGQPVRIPRPWLERPTAPEETVETTFSFLDNMESSQESTEMKADSGRLTNSTNSKDSCT